MKMNTQFIKQLFYFLFLTPIIIALPLITKAQVKGNITNYYYFQGQPHYLQILPNEIFIKTKNNCTTDDLLNLSSKYNELVPDVNYDYMTGYGFMKLNKTLNQEELLVLINKMQNEKYLYYVTPVFYDRENGPKSGLFNEIIVQFKPSLTKSVIQKFLKKQNLEIIRKIDLKGGDTYLLKITDNKPTLDKANEIYLSGMVNYSDPNFLTANSLLNDPNDPYFPMQWSIRNTGSNVPGGVTGVPGCDMRVDSAWTITSGNPNVIVAVNDTGIDTTHLDLIPNLLPGFDAFNNIPSAYSLVHHGTRCSGIIGAVTNNNLNIAGIASGCKLLPVKIIDNNGYISYEATVTGIIYAYQHGAWLINNSYETSVDDAIYNAINDAALYGRNGKGTLCLFASGNANGQIYGMQATHDKILVVGGISPCNQRKNPASCDDETTWGSDYGPNLSVVAPCVKIYTTTTYQGTTLFNGTSSACPNASGVAALILSVDSNLTYSDISRIICRSAEKAGSYTYNGTGPKGLGGWNIEMGYGKINGYNAVKYAVNTYVINHTPLPVNTEQITGNYTVNCVIKPYSNPIVSSETKLFWSKNSAVITDSIMMTNISGNNYTGEIQGSGEGTYRYYIKTKDNTGRVYTSPYDYPYSVHIFTALVDTIKPVISHLPLQNTARKYWPPAITSVIKDNFAIDSAWVYWKINSYGNQRQFKLNKTNDTLFSAPFNTTANQMNFNDTVFYKIIALDKSIHKNKDSTAVYNFVVLSYYSISIVSPYSSDTNYVQDVPFYTGGNGARSDMIYSKNLIKNFGGGSGWISKIGFFIKYRANGVPKSFQDFSVKLKNHSDSVLTGYLTDMTEIYHTNNFDITSYGWVYITFPSPFYYDSLYHLGVEVCFSGYSQPNWLQCPVGYFYQSYDEPFRTYKGIGGCSIYSGNGNGYLPFTKIFFDENTVTNITEPKTINKYVLSQNYPNPFNPVTQIRFNILKKELVTLKIYDILGREVTVLVNEERLAGSYLIDFNAQSLSSGIYFYKLTAGEFTDVKKMMLIR
ncbi:MAG: S8 family serine peptidase [Ignavibacteriae bacterium]|nr:S8 family serine peptidase [Ignavibacteriota bacterium]